MRDGTLERRRAILSDAVATILSDYGAGVDLDSVAHEIGTSRRQLQRVFPELSDRGFRDPLATVGMSRARALLAATEMPMGRIARAVGYGEPAQFTKAFRHPHHMPPRDYGRAATA